MQTIKGLIVIGMLFLTFGYFLYAAKWWMILLLPIGMLVWTGIELAELFKHGAIPWFTIFLGMTGWLWNETEGGNKYVRNVKWIIGGIVLVGVIFGLLTLTLFHTEPFASTAEEMYFQTLDEWVRRKGAIEEVNTVIAPTCGRLVSLLSTMTENVGFLSIRRDDWDFRLDVCVQMTVNRVYPQPFLQKPEVIEVTCHKNNGRFFTTMCRRSGF